MAKKLSSLEALNKVVYCYGYDKNIEIIEKALNKNVELNLANIELEHHLKLANKELKSLEIIVKKNVDLKTLKEAFIFNGNNKEQCEMYNVNQWSWVFQLAYMGCVEDKSVYPDLTQEEFDLLKEMLLWRKNN